MNEYKDSIFIASKMYKNKDELLYITSDWLEQPFQDSYFGGRIELFRSSGKVLIPKLRKTFEQVNINGLYSSVMSDEKLPSGPCKIISLLPYSTLSIEE